MGLPPYRGEIQGDPSAAARKTATPPGATTASEHSARRSPRPISFSARISARRPAPFAPSASWRVGLYPGRPYSRTPIVAGAFALRNRCAASSGFRRYRRNPNTFGKAVDPPGRPNSRGPCSGGISKWQPAADTSGSIIRTPLRGIRAHREFGARLGGAAARVSAADGSRFSAARNRAKDATIIRDWAGG